MKWLIGAITAIGVMATAQWAIHSAPPSEAVLVMRQNVAVGQRLVASDLTVGSIPVPRGHGALLLPASLEDLVPGEYLTSGVLAGSPLLSNQISRAQRSFKLLASPTGDACQPTKGL